MSAPRRRRFDDHARPDAPRDRLRVVPPLLDPPEVAGAQSLALERAARETDRQGHQAFDQDDVDQLAERLYGECPAPADWSRCQDLARAMLRGTVH